MNLISAQLDLSHYDNYRDLLNIKIDDCFLDQYLEDLYPAKDYEAGYKGTVPTLLFGMEIDRESEIVWERILPDTGKKSRCPILMCPDDRDFSCTIVIAEIETLESRVIWHRLGLDVTREYDAEEIGSEVQWFTKVPAFTFGKESYVDMITAFKNRFEMDKANRQKTVKFQ